MVFELFFNCVTVEPKNFESLLKVLGRKVYPEFSLVISLHDWVTLGALAADKN